MVVRYYGIGQVPWTNFHVVKFPSLFTLVIGFIYTLGLLTYLMEKENVFLESSY